MLSETGPLLTAMFLIAAGFAAAATAIAILRKGGLYHRLKPEARPRRWVLFLCPILFGVFWVCFPVWVIWPQAFISRVLLLIFALTFAVVGLALKRFHWLVDWYCKRRGWPLR
jgi:hypothetical protein